eukprot:4375324-Prymnesium_polylepis.1
MHPASNKQVNPHRPPKRREIRSSAMSCLGGICASVHATHDVAAPRGARSFLHARMSVLGVTVGDVEGRSHAPCMHPAFRP